MKIPTTAVKERYCNEKPNCTQRTAKKLNSLENKTYAERLREFGIFGLVKRRQRSNTIVILKQLNSCQKVDKICFLLLQKTGHETMDSNDKKGDSN